jgi:hypothetical protein
MRLDRQDLLDNLDEFHSLYLKRPIKENDGGMKSPHMFSAWFSVKTLKPEVLIESGVWKGLGTWFFRQASPKTKMVCIDPAPQMRLYTDPDAVYVVHDFLQIDWSNVSKENTLLFFDDHQNFMERLKYASECGFKQIMCEDNYPFDQGDCYTPKKILSGAPYVIDRGGKREWMLPSQDDLSFFNSVVSYYEEFPPIYIDSITRWANGWDGYTTPRPLLSDTDKYPTFYSERFDYTWICYMELK